MESIRELFRIGHGPSSSHTMGPLRAAEEFLKKEPNAPAYRVTLFGSLAATGKGHLTFQVLKDAFAGADILKALAAARALDHQVFALLSDGRHRISFDEVV